jgi:hypothetical protein
MVAASSSSSSRRSRSNNSALGNVDGGSSRSAAAASPATRAKHESVAATAAAEDHLPQLPTESALGDDDENDNDDNDDVHRHAVMAALLVRAYHLPGNTSWWQDWYQYIINNHAVLGIWFHHAYHPVSRHMRICFLLASALFGLALTNIIYLAFVFSDTNYNRGYVMIRVTNATAVAATTVAGGGDAAIAAPTVLDTAVVSSVLSVTNGNIALWTIGSALHALFDNVIWALAACTWYVWRELRAVPVFALAKNHLVFTLNLTLCYANIYISCMEGRGLTSAKLARYKSTGVFFVVLAVVMVTALATFVVALRAALGQVKNAHDVHSYGINDDQVPLFQVEQAHDYQFVLAYLVELLLNYFFYYFVVGTVLFSGLLSCGRFPVLGGRPYELREAAAAAAAAAQAEEGLEVEWNGTASSSTTVLSVQTAPPSSKTNIGTLPSGSAHSSVCKHGTGSTHTCSKQGTRK